MAKIFVAVWLVALTSWYHVDANQVMVGSDPHHNYYLAAAAVSYTGNDQQQQVQVPQMASNRHGNNRDRPVMIVEHVHKEEIDEDRIRISPQHYQQHVRGGGGGMPFYPFQFQNNNHRAAPPMFVNPWYPTPQGHFYIQRQGGYNWKSENYV